MYTEVTSNKRKTFLLILGFLVVIGGFGWILSKLESTPVFLVAILIFALAYAWFSYYNSARIALMLSGAQAVTKKQSPRLYRLVENLSITAGLPTPKVYIIDDPSPNAFATGRNPEHAAVAATTGLLEIMDDQELEGVIGHELAHVGNYDIRVMGIVLMLVTVIVYISDFIMRMTFWGGFDDEGEGGRNPLFMVIGLVAALVAPAVAMLLQLAVSRKREYLADASGALLTRYPEGLASALRKIENYPKGLARASNATAHLFIANPLKGKKRGSWFVTLFSTHPPTQERIAKLETMENKL